MVIVRKLGVALGVLGLLLVAAAAILKFAIFPSQAQLPSDTHKVRQYSGTASVMLNPAAITSGDLSKLVMRNEPITIDRTVKVTDTSGQKAVVNDARVLKASDGTQLNATDYTYAVDRKSLEPVEPFGGAQAVPDDALTVSWPIGTDKHDYTAYVVDTQGTVPAKYSGEEKVNGLTTYVFKTNVSPAKITEPKVLASYPTTLPKSMLSVLPQALGYSAAQTATLAKLLTVMPNPVPISYMYSGQTTLWIAPDTGAIVKTTKSETRTAVLNVPGVAQPVTLAPVMSLTYTQTPNSVAEAVSDAKDDASAMTLYGTTLPLIGLIVGVVSIAAGAVLFFFRRHPTPPVPGPEHEKITPTLTR